MPITLGTEHASSSTSIRRFLNAPALRALFCLSLLLTTSYLYAKKNFYRDPGSAFYDESRAFDRRYSAFREQQANEWLKTVADGTAPEPILADQNATICASFLTVPRFMTEPYLDTAIATALDRLTPAERRAMRLNVFFATTDPNSHATFKRPWLRKVVDEVYTYRSILSPSDIDHVQELENANDGLRKAPYDYTLPLRHCEESKAKYFVLFEDDIVLADGWLARTLNGIQQVEQKMKDAGRRSDWLFFRLFNQERNTGWPSKEPWSNHEAKTSIWIGLAAGVLLIGIRRKSKAVRANVDNWTLTLILLFIPAFVVLFFQSGKASLLPPRPGVKQETSGCCAQALVFNRMHVDQLVEYLYMRRHEGYHDILTEDYSRMQGFVSWTQYPIVAQHVGTHSSIQKKEGENQKVWSMAFEDLDPRRLARQHGENVRRVFGDWAMPKSEPSAVGAVPS